MSRRDDDPIGTLAAQTGIPFRRLDMVRQVRNQIAHPDKPVARELLEAASRIIAEAEERLGSTTAPPDDESLGRLEFGTLTVSQDTPVSRTVRLRNNGRESRPIVSTAAGSQHATIAEDSVLVSANPPVPGGKHHGSVRIVSDTGAATISVIAHASLPIRDISSDFDNWVVTLIAIVIVVLIVLIGIYAPF